MIDFRYHLVSLIAVFLAVALGIVIGTTALNQPILADIKNQVTALEQDKRSLVLLEPSAFDQWLAGTVEEARALMQLTPVVTFAAGPLAAADVLVA